MKSADIGSRSGSGFFARILAALLIVNIATIGILILVTYSQNTYSVTKRTKENIHQQVSIIADKFEEQYQHASERILDALVGSPTLNDYLLGSEAEKLVISRRLEREYLRYLKDYPFISSISFIDEDYKVAVSIKKGFRQSGLIDLANFTDAEKQLEWKAVLNLYEKLKSVPLLLFSGNMEWFMPPRESQIIGPFSNGKGKTLAAIGQSKLDTNTGTFGGVIIIEFHLQHWFAELKNVQFFNEAPIWLFDEKGNVLVSPDVGTRKLDPWLLMSEARTPEVKMVDTIEGLIAYIDLPLGPNSQFVRLAASIPTTLLLLDLDPVIDFFSVVLVGSILLLVLISYSVSRYLSHPVKALQTTQHRLANAQRIARLGHWELEVNSQELVLSDYARVILGIDKNLIKLSFGKFIECAISADRQTLTNTIQEVIDTHRSGSIEHLVLHQDGSEISVHQDIEIETGKTPRVVGTIQDISLRKNTEQRIKKLAYYDSVTGLANRTLLIQLAQNAIKQADSINRLVGFIFLDLDHFKRINDTFGHDAGDELLRQVSERLRHCMRISDTTGSLAEFELSEKTVARLGGDEFIILLTHLVRPEDVKVVAARIKEHLSRKFTITGKDVFISGSLGISLYPVNGDNVDDLLRHADAAMYHAKNNGRNRFEFFTSSIERDIKHRLGIETRLHQALEEKSFILHYQPRVDIATNRIVAVEALIRWMDPSAGMISPDQFIPVAEETGLIIPIGEWVLHEACQQLGQWRDAFGYSITMSINLSPVQFNAANLLDTLKDAIDGSEIDTDCIELELTENALFENMEASIQLAEEFKSLGIRLSIDDFGTGYSSLQQLKRFPVDIIKIDRSFIRDILNDSDDALIVKTAISLGHNLRLRVVAEGVENEEQMNFLKKHACDEAQGYLLGRPQPASDIAQLLSQDNRFSLESRSNVGRTIVSL